MKESNRRMEAIREDREMTTEDWIVMHRRAVAAEVSACPPVAQYNGVRLVRVHPGIACVSVENNTRRPAAIYVPEAHMEEIQPRIDRELYGEVRSYVSALTDTQRAFKLTLRSAEAGEQPQPATKAYIVVADAISPAAR